MSGRAMLALAACAGVLALGAALYYSSPRPPATPTTTDPASNRLAIDTITLVRITHHPASRPFEVTLDPTLRRWLLAKPDSNAPTLASEGAVKGLLMLLADSLAGEATTPIGQLPTDVITLTLSDAQDLSRTLHVHPTALGGVSTLRDGLRQHIASPDLPALLSPRAMQAWVDDAACPDLRARVGTIKLRAGEHAIVLQESRSAAGVSAWSMLEPVITPADRSAVEQVLASLRGARLGSPAPLAATLTNERGFDTPVATVKLTSQLASGSLTQHLTFGSQASTEGAMRWASSSISHPGVTLTPITGTIDAEALLTLIKTPEALLPPLACATPARDIATLLLSPDRAALASRAVVAPLEAQGARWVYTRSSPSERAATGSEWLTQHSSPRALAPALLTLVCYAQPERTLLLRSDDQITGQFVLGGLADNTRPSAVGVASLTLRDAGGGALATYALGIATTNTGSRSLLVASGPVLRVYDEAGSGDVKAVLDSLRELRD